jgi:hypothetical protein
MSLDTDMILSTKINSKLIGDLTVKCKTVKLPDNDIKEIPRGLVFGDDYIDATQKA